MRVLALLALLAMPASATEALFDAHGCRACHKVGPRGGNSGPDLTLAGVRRPADWLEEWLADPVLYKPDTTMPRQGLPAAERAALAAYLAAQKGQAWSATRPWTGLAGKAMGKTIYLRAGCVACHGTAGRGGHPNRHAHGGIIPALAPLMATYTAPELKRKIRGGSVPETHGGPRARVNMPAWDGIFDETELDALSEYLLSLAAAEPKGEW